MCALPVAAVYIEHDDDETQAVARQVWATEELGESACTMLPSCHLMNNKKTKKNMQELFLYLFYQGSYWLAMLANLWEVQDDVDADSVSFKDPIRHFGKALVTNAILQLTAQEHESHLSPLLLLFKT